MEYTKKMRLVEVDNYLSNIYTQNSAITMFIQSPNNRMNIVVKKSDAHSCDKWLQYKRKPRVEWWLIRQIETNFPDIGTCSGVFISRARVRFEFYEN